MKPLVPVGGRTLLERVLASLAEAAPSEVVVILNETSAAVQDHVVAEPWPFALRWLVETTPSSMHSFLRVVEVLAADGDPGPFLISTVDTIASPGAFAAFADASRKLPADVVLALAAPRPEDEKPLLARLAPGGARVEAIGSAVPHGPAVFATAGYYAVRSSVLREADEARHEGVGALRVFLERLLDRGYELAGVPVAAGVDVDRPADIRMAEAFLRQVGA
jgi:NDP-sugar pyrophosphorylase family protein